MSVMSQLVVFLPGEPAPQTVCFTVTTFDDSIAERDEYFSLDIESTPRGALIGTSNMTTVFISDNDGECLINLAKLW